MADTNFTDNNTALANRIVAAWLNDVNVFVYRGTWAPSHNAVDIGTSIKAPRTDYFGTSMVTPLVQSSGAVDLVFGANSGTDWNIAATGKHWLPGTDNTQNIGSTSKRVASLFTPIIDSGTTGPIAIKLAGAEALRIYEIDATPVQFLAVGARATGAPATLSVFGTDTNGTLSITVPGAGSIGFFTRTAAASITGAVQQFSILDTAGSTRNITITGSNGGNPVIDVTAGAIKLGSGTADIQWGKANVALGGGAAPTVGTIGGSGPAAAAQRNWLRFIESDGTASFIPVWR